MQQGQVGAPDARGRDERAEEQPSAGTQLPPQPAAQVERVVDEVQEAEAEHSVEGARRERQVERVRLYEPDAGTHPTAVGQSPGGVSEHVAGAVSDHDRTVAGPVGGCRGDGGPGGDFEQRAGRRGDGPAREAFVVNGVG